MALTASQQRQLLIDLVSGRITKAQYDKVLYDERIKDLRQANKLPVVNEQGVIDVKTIDTTTRSPGITNIFGTPPQDIKPTTTDSMGAQEAAAFEKALEVGGTAAVPPVQPVRETVSSNNQQDNVTETVTETVTEQPDEYGFTSADYKAGIPIYRKDAPAGGERVYSKQALKDALSNGYSLTTVDITEGPDAGTSAANAGADKVTDTTTVTTPQTGFAGTQIWNYQGNNYVVWQIPGTMMFMRYAASDTDLDMLYSGRERPPVTSVTDTMWTSSVYFGNVNELDDKTITTGDSPFVGFLDNFEKATIGRPWLKTDDEMFALWVEGYVENRDILEEEWANTEWWNRSTKEERDWLVLSKGRGIGDSDFPADAKTYLEQNRILYLQLMKDSGISNAASIRDANGNTLAEWFADQVTFGKFDDVKAQEQIQAMSDVTSGIAVDESITNWLQGKGEVAQTQTGYASARALALKWLGPVYGKLDEEKLAEYAGIIRNAENPDVGADILSEKLKAQRKVLFSTDLYDENLTYDDIAAPWQNYSYQFLGQRIDETSENWLNVLLANNQTEAIKELTAYGLNKNIEKVIDTMSDNLAGAVGISESGVQRGFST